MSLKDPARAREVFDVDESVAKILKVWGKERDADVARVQLARAASRLQPEQREQLVARLAEISLGVLFTLLDDDAG